MKKTAIALAVSACIASPAMAGSFINGGFETGDASGWTTGDGYRASISNTNLDPTDATYPGTLNHSAIIGTSYVDPVLGALLGSTVYSGNYSYRVEDTVNGGYFSVIKQTVTNYTDPDIFFAWKAVLDGAHGPNSAAEMLITLTDKTTNTVLISRQYNASSGGGGVDPRFSFANNNYYTPTWQIEQLSIGAGLAGHDFELSVLASDCSPTGHWGYVYIDGFGAVTPPPVVGVPEPESLALVGLGLLGLAASRRRKNV